jgi:cytochrome bd-type quinol oxidase subunit 1
MKKPPVVTQNDEVTIVGHVFGTPLVVKGMTGFQLHKSVLGLF